MFSVWKFYLFNLLTFGIYQTYWGWKNWEIIKRVKGLSLNSSFRGLFIPFYSFSLFKEILSLAKERGYRSGYSFWLLASGFLILNLLLKGIGNTDEEINFPTFVIITAVFMGLITSIVAPVIKAMNYYLMQNTEEDSKFDIKPNYGLIIFLVSIFVIYFLIGMYSA